MCSEVGHIGEVSVTINRGIERAERYRNISARFRPRPRDKAGEHRALMKAAVARDADRACELIAKHIQTTTDNVIKYASEVIGDS